MFSKLYEKLKLIIKDNYKFIIGDILLLFICLYPLPVSLYAGGGIVPLKNRFTIDNGYKEKGSFNLCYVKKIRSTIPTYLLSYVFDWDRENIKEEKLSENDTRKEIWQREKMYLDESVDNAIINAYKRAGEEITINKVQYKVLSISDYADTDLLVGDILLEINGNKISEYEDVINSLKEAKLNTNLSIKVLRDKQEKMCYSKVFLHDKSKKIGVYLLKVYDYSVARNIKIHFNNREGGSSGGLMLSLAIYNRLIKNDLTKGDVIVGTGTISSDGTVGSIGGVKYKLSGAVKNKAKIFLVPDGENYQDAINEQKRNNYKIKIVPVKTFDDAVNYLEGRI